MFSVSAVMPYNKVREEKTFIRKIIGIVLIKREHQSVNSLHSIHLSRYPWDIFMVAK